MGPGGSNENTAHRAHRARCIVGHGFIRAAEIKVIASNGVKKRCTSSRPPSSTTPDTSSSSPRPRHRPEAPDRGGRNLRPRHTPRRRDRRPREAGQGRRGIAPRHRALGRGHRNQKKGAPRPDIRTPGAFQAHAPRGEIHHLGERRPERHLLREACSSRIGIAEQMKPKVVPASTGVEVGKLVAGGKPSSASSSSTN